MGLVEPATLEAYEIAKAVAAHASDRELLFPAQDFYRASALTAARHRIRKTR